MPPVKGGKPKNFLKRWLNFTGLVTSSVANICNPKGSPLTHTLTTASNAKGKLYRETTIFAEDLLPGRRYWNQKADLSKQLWLYILSFVSFHVIRKNEHFQASFCYRVFRQMITERVSQKNGNRKHTSNYGNLYEAIITEALKYRTQAGHWETKQTLGGSRAHSEQAGCFFWNVTSLFMLQFWETISFSQNVLCILVFSWCKLFFPSRTVSLLLFNQNKCSHVIYNPLPLVNKHPCAHQLAA